MERRDEQIGKLALTPPVWPQGAQHHPLGANPHAPQSLMFMAGTVVYGIGFAILGGLIAARLAPARPRLHAVVVSLIIAAGATASLFSSPAGDATWSQWTALVLMAPSASLGPLLTHR